MKKNSYYCPSCGYKLWFMPWVDESPADEICPSCYIQFGYNDFAGGNTAKRQLVYEKWRNDWINMGMPWRSSRKKPEHWSPNEQLKNLEKLQ